MVGGLARDAYAGLIVDGYHVDLQACQIAFRAKGKQQMMLVTDAILAATDATEVPFFDTKILRDGDKLTAGRYSCWLMFNHAGRRQYRQHVRHTLADAVEMAATTPAKMLGLEHEFGCIAAGHVANFMLLDEHLNIAQLWLHGEPTQQEG